jgi:hypothetical protein
MTTILKSILRQGSEVATATFRVNPSGEILCPLDIWSPSTPAEIDQALIDLPASQIKIISEAGSKLIEDPRSITVAYVNSRLDMKGLQFNEDYCLRHGIPALAHLRKTKKLDYAEFQDAAEVSMKVEAILKDGYTVPYSTRLMAFLQGALYFVAEIDRNKA